MVLNISIIQTEEHLIHNFRGVLTINSNFKIDKCVLQLVNSTLTFLLLHSIQLLWACMPLQQGLCDDKNLLTLICTSRFTKRYIHTNTYMQRNLLHVTTQLAAAEVKNRTRLKYVIYTSQNFITNYNSI